MRRFLLAVVAAVALVTPVRTLVLKPQPAQHSLRRNSVLPRATVDVCANVKTADATSDFLGFAEAFENATLCLCASTVHHFVQSNFAAQTMAFVYGPDAVELTLNSMINSSPDREQCSYTQHARPVCSSKQPCGFTCSNGFTPTAAPGCDKPSTCTCPPPLLECNGHCGKQVCSSARPRKRAQAAFMEDLRDVCQSPSRVCGIVGGGRGHSREFECIDVNTDLESCGGCMVDLFPSKASPAGVDCTAIEGVRDVSCRRGNCAVTSCKPGWDVLPNGTSCVLSKLSMQPRQDATLAASISFDFRLRGRRSASPPSEWSLPQPKAAESKRTVTAVTATAADLSSTDTPDDQWGNGRSAIGAGLSAEGSTTGVVASSAAETVAGANLSHKAPAAGSLKLLAAAAAAAHISVGGTAATGLGDATTSADTWTGTSLGPVYGSAVAATSSASPGASWTDASSTIAGEANSGGSWSSTDHTAVLGGIAAWLSGTSSTVSEHAGPVAAGHGGAASGSVGASAAAALVASASSGKSWTGGSGTIAGHGDSDVSWSSTHHPAVVAGIAGLLSGTGSTSSGLAGGLVAAGHGAATAFGSVSASAAATLAATGGSWTDSPGAIAGVASSPGSWSSPDAAVVIVGTAATKAPDIAASLGGTYSITSGVMGGVTGGGLIAAGQGGTALGSASGSAAAVAGSTSLGDSWTQGSGAVVAPVGSDGSWRGADDAGIIADVTTSVAASLDDTGPLVGGLKSGLAASAGAVAAATAGAASAASGSPWSGAYQPGLTADIAASIAGAGPSIGVPAASLTAEGQERASAGAGGSAAALGTLIWPASSWTHETGSAGGGVDSADSWNGRDHLGVIASVAAALSRGDFVDDSLVATGVVAGFGLPLSSGSSAGSSAYGSAAVDGSSTAVWDALTHSADANFWDGTPTSGLAAAARVHSGIVSPAIASIAGSSSALASSIIEGTGHVHGLAGVNSGSHDTSHDAVTATLVSLAAGSTVAAAAVDATFAGGESSAQPCAHSPGPVVLPTKV